MPRVAATQLPSNPATAPSALNPEAHPSSRRSLRGPACRSRVAAARVGGPALAGRSRDGDTRSPVMAGAVKRWQAGRARGSPTLRCPISAPAARRRWRGPSPPASDPRHVAVRRSGARRGASPGAPPPGVPTGQDTRESPSQRRAYTVRSLSPRHAAASPRPVIAIVGLRQPSDPGEDSVTGGECSPSPAVHRATWTTKLGDVPPVGLDVCTPGPGASTFATPLASTAMSQAEVSGARPTATRACRGAVRRELRRSTRPRR